MLIEDAKERAAHLIETKAQILADWESEVLSLDYLPILLRYKTDYTSIFKIFNSQYRNDKKLLQAFSKTVIKKLPDDVAADLLFRLKDFHEQAAWFEERKTVLSETLSVYYNGVDSKWDAALSAVETVARLRDIPDAYISNILIEMVAKEHTEAIISLVLVLPTLPVTPTMGISNCSL